MYSNSLSGKKIQINTNKDPNFIGELNRIGININQIAKKCNSSDELTASDSKQSLGCT
ncbi:plasmid mobilization relaxosome protein MobC [Flavobacterium sp. GNP001]